MSRGSVVPKDKNGRVDWLAYFRTTWPIAMFIGGIVFWFGGRMQSIPEKRVQNDLWNSAWRTRSETNTVRLESLQAQLRNHETLAGHKVMDDRYTRLIKRLDTIERDMAALEKDFTKSFLRKDEHSILHE